MQTDFFHYLVYMQMLTCERGCKMDSALMPSLWPPEFPQSCIFSLFLWKKQLNLLPSLPHSARTTNNGVVASRKMVGMEKSTSGIPTSCLKRQNSSRVVFMNKQSSGLSSFFLNLTFPFLQSQELEENKRLTQSRANGKIWEKVPNSAYEHNKLKSQKQIGSIYR